MIALASGLLVSPVAIFTVLYMVLGNSVDSHGNRVFWGSVLGGAILAAIAIYPIKRIPLWLAALIGPICVLLILASAVVVHVSAAT